MTAERSDFAVKHELHEVHFDLRLARAGEVAKVKVIGRSKTKRSNLWHLEEEFTPGDQYGAADLIHHLALVALQDRPRNTDTLHRALRGGPAWEDVQLPF